MYLNIGNLKISDKEISKLIDYSRKGNLKQCEKLIKEGVEVDEEDEYGQTGLFIAAYNGKKKVCELLIEHGAVVDK